MPVVSSALTFLGARLGSLINWLSKRVIRFQKFKYGLLDTLHSTIKFKTKEKIDFYGVALSEKSYWRLRSLGKKEPYLCKLLRGLDYNDVFWDIGANVGQFSLYAAYVTDADIVSFEIEPASYLSLVSNIVANNLGEKILALPFGLGANSSTMSISMPQNIISSSGRSYIYNKVELNRSNTLKVPILSANAALKSFNLPLPTFIKLDVDGPELNVLQGMTEIFEYQRLKSIVVECVTVGHEANLKYIDAFLSKYGFAVLDSESTTDNSQITQNVHFYRS